MSNKPWKVLERKAAKLIGGKRIIGLGRKMEDVSSDIFIVECKQGKQVPISIYNWYMQAKQYLKRPENSKKIPLVMMQHPKRKISLVILSANDFKNLFNKTKDMV